MYIFGGYVNGDKSNDLWKYDVTLERWTCLEAGDFKLEPHKQNHKKYPPPRIGARMVCIDEKTLYVHNGHDNDNEKLHDIWKFDLTSNAWSEIQQKGEVPHVSKSEILFIFK